MKKLREWHLYLGCLFAPVLILFAVSGAWQLFGLHRGLKDGTYRPAHVVTMLSEIHMYQHASGDGNAPTLLRAFMLAAAVGLIVTTALGIVMAFRFGQSRRSVILFLVAGVMIPTAMLLIFH